MTCCDDVQGIMYLCAVVYWLQTANQIVSAAAYKFESVQFLQIRRVEKRTSELSSDNNLSVELLFQTKFKLPFVGLLSTRTQVLQKKPSISLQIAPFA
jgi:hypothetical protein